MREEEIRESQTVKDWLKIVRSESTGSDETSKIYVRKLWQFCNWIEKTPEDLVAEASKHYREEIGLQKKSWAEMRTIDYFEFQTKERKPPLARTTAKTDYGVLRSFFRANGILFIGKTPEATVRTRSIQIDDADLDKFWRLTTPQEKLPIAILRSTGWRPEDVTDLTYGDVKKDYERNEKRIYIEKISEKEDIWVATFLTEEATALLHLAIDQRIRNDDNMTEITKIFTYEKKQLSQYVKQASERAGVKLTPKTFRKLFRTRCSPIIGRDAVSRMAGWTIQGVGKNYDLPPREETLKRFLQVENLLTFEKRIAVDEEAQKANMLNVLRMLYPEAKVKSIELMARQKAKMSKEELAELIKKETAEPEKANCDDGQHCQKIVSEENLGEFLSKGARVIATLPSGKIVIDT